MLHDLHALQNEYDDLLMKEDRTKEDEDRIAQIETCVLEMFSGCYSLALGVIDDQP